MRSFLRPAPPGLIATNFLTPVYYHADRWVLKGNTLIRLHPRARKTLFRSYWNQGQTARHWDALASERVTEMTFSDGSKKTFTDDWRRSDDPCAKVDSFCWSHDLQNFLPNPQVTESQARHPLCPSHSESRRRPDVPVSNFLRVNLSQVSTLLRGPWSLSVEDTFKKSLNKAKEGSGTLEDLKSLVLQAVSASNFLRVNLSQVSTLLRGPCHFLLKTLSRRSLNKAKRRLRNFGRFEVACVTGCFRLGLVDRSTVCARSLVDFSNRRSSRASWISQGLCSPHSKIRTFRRLTFDGARMTLIITEDGATRWFFDDWHEQGDVELDKDFCWSNLFFARVKWTLKILSPLVDDTLAQKAKGVKAPGEPTDLEVLEHNLTHLPFS